MELIQMANYYRVKNTKKTSRQFYALTKPPFIPFQFDELQC